jgi:hypothetical protein
VTSGGILICQRSMFRMGQDLLYCCRPDPFFFSRRRFRLNVNPSDSEDRSGKEPSFFSGVLHRLEPLFPSRFCRKHASFIAF